MTESKKQLWVIVAIVFLGFFGISMPYLIFPALFLNPEFFILSPEASHVTRSILLGVTLAVYPIGQFIGSPILGALSDDYGRKQLMSASLLVTAVCSLLSGFAIQSKMLFLLIASRFIAGLMEGNIAIARGMAADLKDLPKHFTFGKINAVTSFGYLVGPLVGSILTDQSFSKRVSAATPFYIVSILFVFVSALSMIVLKSSKVTREKSVSFKERIHFVKRIHRLFKSPTLKTLMITSTFFTLGVDIFYEFGPVYLTEKWSLVPARLVFYNVILCLGLMFGNGWLPTYLSKRTVSSKPMVLAMCGYAALLLMTLVASVKLFMILLFGACGVAIGTAVTLLTVKISDSASDQVQGEVMGTQLALRVLGDGVICLFGGVLLIFSPKPILVFAAMLSLFAACYYIKRASMK